MGTFVSQLLRNMYLVPRSYDFYALVSDRPLTSWASILNGCIGFFGCIYKASTRSWKMKSEKRRRRRDFDIFCDAVYFVSRPLTKIYGCCVFLPRRTAQVVIPPFIGRTEQIINSIIQVIRKNKINEIVQSRMFMTVMKSTGGCERTSKKQIESIIDLILHTQPSRQKEC